MFNRIAQLGKTRTNPVQTSRFGDLRRRQPLYLSAPRCAVSPILATEFLDLLRCSVSLSLVEKCQLLLSLPSFQKHTIEGLVDVMRTEQIAFQALTETNQDKLQNLELTALADWWRVERWFWQQGRFEFEPILFIAKVDPQLPPNVEFLLQQLSGI